MIPFEKTKGTMGKPGAIYWLYFNTFLTIKMGYLIVVLLSFEQLSLFAFVFFKLHLALYYVGKTTRLIVFVVSNGY